ncbi:metallo-beta-lactamase superfamily protein [Maribacter vaceletii]|uniref:Metallo-beta-lactamase superfamily protein n=2 Tax=Maribacter vaceletii TaxID=1206816 RepID=A0A495DTZ5_9FLAO|nr:metallo-beta-lactamase superfamily protein [Maribacter vaceletii]
MNQLEIDMLPVGDGEKSGDALAMRFGDFSNKEKEQYIVVIDGGSKDSGKKLVELIKNQYGMNYVDLVISTHPDSDHTSGLRVILEEMSVGKLWMHLPWNHSDRIRDLFHDGRITDESLKERMRKAYRYAYELEQIANEKNIPIEEPFAGTSFLNGTIQVLGPTEKYYEELLVNSAKTPEQKMAGLVGSLERTFASAKSTVLSWIEETFDIETLDESGDTSSENNSSVVNLLNFDNKKFLFTGDSGIPALKKVIEYSKVYGIDISRVNWKQVPHHGSHRNISPSILDEIKTEYAFVSASKGAPKHPSYKVTNAYIRRGANVYTTEGNILNHHLNCNTRNGYGTAVPFTFQNKVQE